MQSVRPTWIEDLSTFYEGRIARQFVLHFNITDFVIDTNERIESGKGEYERRGDVVNVADQPVTMREYLHSFLFQALQCQAVYTYSLAGGLIADDRSAFLSNSNESGQALIRGQTNNTRKNIALQLLYDASKTLEINPRTRKQTGQPEEGQEIELPDDIAENFKLLGHLLRQPHYATGSGGPAQGNNHAETPVAVILDYAEKMIPYQLGDGHGDREQLQALEVVQRWALDPLIRKTKNLVLLLTNNIANIPTDVYAEGSGCKAIRVPLPSEGERAAYIRFAMTRGRPRFVPLDPGNFQQPEQALRLARVTQGMRLRDIDNVSRRVIVEARKRQRSRPDLEEKPPIMKLEDVQRAKAEVIEAQSAQLLEIVPPVRGFNEIGGLEKLKIYLRKRTVLMRSGKYLPLVPSGLLLAGPPGTGKTIIAEALATESGFNLVKMRNIQDKWVGSSERNLELVMNLLKDLYPVVVFIDEIDQAMVRRDTGQSGDSGVGARMFARILEEMSNASNRGRILWVAATNRADIIDAALLRRFDRVVPLLVPDVRESCRIFATILSTIMKQSTDHMQVAYGESLQQSGRKDVLGRPDPTQDDLEKFLPVAHVTAEKGLTGAAIEIIVRRAIEIAYEEKYDEGAKDNIQSLASGLPLIELRHLQMALHDFKPNYNRLTYDHQSLLALRACNFYSIIPSLPKTDLYESIQTTEGLIDSDKLDIAIGQIEAHLRSISMNS
jgi:SpoVK/Ycf46/Vps4 family AAA+-type ATPase